MRRLRDGGKKRDSQSEASPQRVQKLVPKSGKKKRAGARKKEGKVYPEKGKEPCPQKELGRSGFP